MTKRKMIVLTGPTAVGKTELSIALAHQLNGAVISADSMQVYRYMDIGTAKIKPEEMDGIDHYLVDVLEPDEEFNVVRFQQMAKQALNQIYEQGKIPILVGGTGFYIQALLKDIDFEETNEKTAFRKEMEFFAKEKGALALHEELKKVDEQSAKSIHPNNVKRVIRALEFYYETKEPISAHNEKQKQKKSPYDFRYFVLTDDRKILYERIEKRIDNMMEQGLLEEVTMLKNKGYKRDMVSMQGLGYKELFAYLEGETTLENAVAILKRDTRHFAKRQLTWFRREEDVIWLDKQIYPKTNDLLLKMQEYLWTE